jgi:glycine/D-amino acid oxidase-like deaminating enzyme
MAATRVFDLMIVGQGLAGSVLYWQARLQGLRCCLVDPGFEHSASAVAAGLITPITGKRLTLAQRWAEYWPAARSLYRHIEQITQTDLLIESPALRWFASPEERELFRRRLAAGDYAGVQVEEWGPDSPVGDRTPCGGCTFNPAARLQVRQLLQMTRQRADSDGELVQALVADGDWQVTPAGVEFPGLRLRGQRLVFCRGAAERLSGLFPAIDFRPAKGEILRLENPLLQETRTLHRGLWIAPQPAGDFLAGSTYEWNVLDEEPTPAGCATILHGVREWLPGPWRVLDQRAGIRPSVAQSRPVVQTLPGESRIGVLNGLGARGSLWAPLTARELLRVLRNG